VTMDRYDETSYAGSFLVYWVSPGLWTLPVHTIQIGPGTKRDPRLRKLHTKLNAVAWYSGARPIER
jgi:hypothetical protein